MVVQDTVYKIIYKFLKIILLFYHFLCNLGLFLSHVAATLRNAYSFRVISILFFWPKYHLSGAKQLRGTFMQWIVKKSIINVFWFENNVRFVQVFGWVF